MKQTFNSPYRFFKNPVIVLTFTIFLFSSCQKEGSQNNESFHVTCSVDGKAMSFNGFTFAHIETQAGQQAITINGATGLTADAASVGFVITNAPSGNPITAGTYRDTATKYELLASYAPNVSGIDYVAGTTFYSEAKNAGVTVSNHFTVTISSWTNETVKGTFSGDFYYDGVPAGAKKSITNGDFFVKIQ
jgi:hypothetical protein